MKRNRRQESGWARPSEELTEAIIKTRTHNGLSAHDFAEYFRRDYVSVWRWETGKRVPHRTALVGMLKMAPEDCHAVFERYLGKTIEQIHYEEYLAASGQGLDLSPEWAKEPEKHAESIYGALRERMKMVYSDASKGNRRASQALVRLLQQATKETEELRARR